MFGLGVQEIIVILLVLGFLLAILVGIVLLVIFLVRRQGSGRIAQLEAENRQLREEISSLEGRG